MEMMISSSDFIDKLRDESTGSKSSDEGKDESYQFERDDKSEHSNDDSLSGEYGNE